MTTAIEAYYGGSATVVFSADYRMRASVRFYDLDPDADGLKAKLPRADLLALGTIIHVYNRSESRSFQIADSDGTNIVNAPLGTLTELWLVDQGTQVGTWVFKSHAAGNVERGVPLTVGRQPWRLDIPSGVTGYDMRYTLDGLGYDGLSPVAIIAEMAADVVRGSPRLEWPAVDTGYFPTGSTLLFVQRGILSGRGGAGGEGQALGGFPDPPGDGVDGGAAFRTTMDTGLVNYGTIQGGGGGGGGATSSSTVGGGAGGGGGGYLPGEPGQPHATGGGGATAGLPGRLQAGGGGGTGANTGGAGGSPGTAGSTGGGSGGAGGAAGDSIQSLSTITVTKIRTGTIVGPETTF